MNNIPNRKAICDVLLEQAKADKEIVVLCSDSRGSASMTPFFDAFPEQAVETGIAEQNLVSISAGMAKCGKKAFCFSPASFLSTRSYEQAKVDVAYSNTNVTLVGISGGISYGELGMSHHSAQDIAAMSAIPNMRVYLPSDRFQTAELVKALLSDQKPAYVRVGRNPVEDIYEENCPFVMDEATVIIDGDVSSAAPSSEVDWNSLEEGIVTIAACGEMVRPAILAGEMLAKDGVHTAVLDMYCVKPLDQKAILAAAGKSSLIVAVEEHAPFGGLGSMVSQAVSEHCPKKVIHLALPDAPVITGKSQAVFDYYGLNAEGIAKKITEHLRASDSDSASV
ncbi:MAG: transketolase family protein [Eubacterium sp.]|nr:transketolase family protein [Eubacterium sp.]